MKEKGVVSKIISSNLVEVVFQKTEACAKCGLCQNLDCEMVGIEAVNDMGAKKEDVVEIDIPSGEMVKGSIVVFILPILFLLFGYLLGSIVLKSLNMLAMQEVGSIIFALIGFALSFLVIRWYDKNIVAKKTLRAKVLKIVNKGG